MSRLLAALRCLVTGHRTRPVEVVIAVLEVNGEELEPATLLVEVCTHGCGLMVFYP